MPHPRVSKKPEGQPTRGKTASNRLRRVDNFILLYEPSLLTRTDGLYADSMFVDLGYGFEARTTLESALRFRRMNPELKILGVEIDKERVENALPFADEKTFFRLGGFNIPLNHGEYVRLIRVFNVLRQYEERDFAPAYDRLAPYVLPGGLMIEGTSSPFGSIWVANLVRKEENVTPPQEHRGGVSRLAAPSHRRGWSVPGRVSETKEERSSPALQQTQCGASVAALRMTYPNWTFEALVFSTNFRRGFDVEEFQTVLPKNLIHHMIEGEPINEFFEAWKASAAETSAMKTFGTRQWFIHAAESLARRGYKLNLQRKFLSRGYLIWEL